MLIFVDTSVFHMFHIKEVNVMRTKWPPSAHRPRTRASRSEDVGLAKRFGPDDLAL